MRQEDRVLQTLARDQHHVVGRREVRAAELTSRQWAYRVASGEWVAVMPTVWRHAATPETWEMRVDAGARWWGPRAALAGRSAAAWWGLDGFERDEVEFVVPHARRARGGVALQQAGLQRGQEAAEAFRGGQVHRGSDHAGRKTKWGGGRL